MYIWNVLIQVNLKKNQNGFLLQINSNDDVRITTLFELMYAWSSGTVLIQVNLKKPSSNLKKPTLIAAPSQARPLPMPAQGRFNSG